VHQYREGKVKSTPMRGVKQFLKPDAYKQSEVGRQVTDDGQIDNPSSVVCRPVDGVPLV
jgi:hypothetical protein